MTVPILDDPPASAGARLAAALGSGPVHVPGVHDAVSARLAEAAGFRAVFLSGAGVSASVLGVPDLGYVGLAEMVDQIARVTAATAVPLVADADGGYGGPLQVARTVAAYERAGAAAVQLEDQQLPKRCGHMAGKQLLTPAEMKAKVHAALDARGAALVIARTDAFSVEGFDAALERVCTYAEAGADMVFVEGLADDADLLSRVHRATGRPLVVNRSEAAGDPSPPMSRQVLASAGVRIVLHPVAGLLAAAAATRSVYAAIAATGAAGLPGSTWTELTDLLGLPHHLERDESFFRASS